MGVVVALCVGGGFGSRVAGRIFPGNAALIYNVPMVTAAVVLFVQDRQRAGVTVTTVVVLAIVRCCCSRHR